MERLPHIVPACVERKGSLLSTACRVRNASREMRGLSWSHMAGEWQCLIGGQLSTLRLPWMFQRIGNSLLMHSHSWSIASESFCSKGSSHMLPPPETITKLSDGLPSGFKVIPVDPPWCLCFWGLQWLFQNIHNTHGTVWKKSLYFTEESFLSNYGWKKIFISANGNVFYTVWTFRCYYSCF